MLYTVPFTLVYDTKYRTKHKLKIQAIIHKLNRTQKKITQNAAKQNYPGLVASYDIQPGNEVHLFYNAREPT